MEAMKPDPKKQNAPATDNEVPCSAIYFSAMRDFPLEGVNGGCAKLHATRNRTIVYFRREREYRITETYGDSRREDVVLSLDRAGVCHRPA